MVAIQSCRVCELWNWSLASWSTWAAILAAYMVLCSMLRYRFERAMLKKFNYPDRLSLARMTNDDAQAILRYLITQEFPAFYKLGLQLGLFKVIWQRLTRLVWRKWVDVLLIDNWDPDHLQAVVLAGLVFTRNRI